MRGWHGGTAISAKVKGKQLDPLLGALESAYQVQKDLSRLTNLHFAADE
jgi:hypothetical protein